VPKPLSAAEIATRKPPAAFCRAAPATATPPPLAALVEALACAWAAAVCALAEGAGLGGSCKPVSAKLMLTSIRFVFSDGVSLADTDSTTARKLPQRGWVTRPSDFLECSDSKVLTLLPSSRVPALPAGLVDLRIDERIETAAKRCCRRRERAARRSADRRED
jgi:hypothetical protein